MGGRRQVVDGEVELGVLVAGISNMLFLLLFINHVSDIGSKPTHIGSEPAN